MTYELAKKLKDAGFPFKPTPFLGIGKMPPNAFNMRGSKWLLYPTLSELIEACGEEFACLSKACGVPEPEYPWHAQGWGEENKWDCTDRDCCPDTPVGFTPEEAVARLWLALNKKPLTEEK